MFLEELNRRIRENGINLRLSCIYFFQNISQLPDHSHKTQRTSLSLRMSRIYLGLRPLFQGSLSPSHILHSCNACCLPHPDKNTRKKQHSVNAHTKPLSEKHNLVPRVLSYPPYGAKRWSRGSRAKLFLREESFV